MDSTTHTDRLGFVNLWNLILATTLLYGGLSMLAAIATDRATHAIAFLHTLGTGGLALTLVGSGTAGLHLLRRTLRRHGQWRPALTFAIGVQVVLTVVALVSGDASLVPLFLLIAGWHVVAQRFLGRF